ncbi:rCG37861 [Rattus norvegicus]|uniref:RCG37861 n=1 Tax=Rattus norvegicus TaxID=10116 RepID=A6K605_RAT|nr:rCG37861 [Rattus norvegicus]
MSVFCQLHDFPVGQGLSSPPQETDVDPHKAHRGVFSHIG